MTLKVTAQGVAEMGDLVVSGDIKLAATRATFKSKTGRDTTLDDHKLLIAHAGQDDDDDDLLVQYIEQVEKGEYEVQAIAAE